LVRRIHLTEELIDRRHRGGPRGPSAAPAEHPVERLAAWLRQTLAGHPGSGEIWFFGYGSLIWRPEIDTHGSAVATVHGYHRSFCLWQRRHRGSVEHPCLMMALDRGGTCRGVAYRIEARDVESAIAPVWRREMRGDGYRPRWIEARTQTGRVRALTFVANRAGSRYAGRLPLAAGAERIAEGCGERGPCADYLRRTVESLAQNDIHDRNLWRLQQLVARHLARY
jgi:cation transport protein ChaC